MKGIVFNILEEMVVERGGLSLWQQILDRAGLEGAYTAVSTYDDDQLFALVEHTSKAIDLPIEALIKGYGEFMFARLAAKYPEFVEQPANFFEFLHSIDSVIHLEVRKLLAETHLPEIKCATLDANRLNMTYRSPRKLCLLAEGLVQGAASHYQVEIKINHAVCMHQGSDHCALEIQVCS